MPIPRPRLIHAALAVAAVGLSALTSPAAHANIGIYPIGTINGHAAYAIGPYSTGGECLKTAERLTTYGAVKFGGKFGTCYQDASGLYYAISPYAA